MIMSRIRSRNRLILLRLDPTNDLDRLPTTYAREQLTVSIQQQCAISKSKLCRFVKCMMETCCYVLTVATCSNINVFIFFLLQRAWIPLRAFPSGWTPSSSSSLAAATGSASSLACSTASFDFSSSASDNHFPGRYFKFQY